MENQWEIQKNETVYKIDTIDVDGKPELQFKCLKRLVGERGFEPPTPWSRTRCSTRLSHSPTVRGAAGTDGRLRRIAALTLNYNIRRAPASGPGQSGSES